MFKTYLFRQTFIILCIIAFLHFVATEFYLYLAVTWFDIPMHFLGGVFLAGVFFVFRGKSIRLALLWVLGIGILWEIFELCIKVTFLADGMKYALDTGKDLVLDILGGWIGSRRALKLLQIMPGSRA